MNSLLASPTGLLDEAHTRRLEPAGRAALLDRLALRLALALLLWSARRSRDREEHRRRWDLARASALREAAWLQRAHHLPLD